MSGICDIKMSDKQDKNISSNQSVGVLIGVMGHYNTDNFGDLLLADLLEDSLGSDARALFVLGYGAKSNVHTWARLKQLLKALKCKAFILGGGGYLEARGRAVIAKLLPIFVLLLYARVLGRRAGIFGAGTGDGASWLGRRLAVAICNLCEPIYVRDQYSAELLRTWGVRSRVEVFADLAHVIEVHGRYQQAVTLRMDQQRRVILLHADNLFLLAPDHPRRIQFEELVKALALLPTCDVVLLFDYITDPRLLAEWKGSKGIRVVACSSVKETLYEIGKADLVLSGKFHVPLVSYTLRKQVIAFSKHCKTKTLFTSLGIESAYQPDVLTNSRAYEIITQLLAQAWTPEQEVSRAGLVQAAVNLSKSITIFCEQVKRQQEFV